MEQFKYEHNEGDLINRLKKKGIDVSTLIFTKNERKHEIGVKNDLEAAKVIMKEYPYWNYCAQTLYVFDDKPVCGQMMKIFTILLLLDKKNICMC